MKKKVLEISEKVLDEQISVNAGEREELTLQVKHVKNFFSVSFNLKYLLQFFYFTWKGGDSYFNINVMLLRVWLTCENEQKF